MSRAKARAETLLSVLRSKKRILIVTHDNPDPDAIGAAMALKLAISSRLHAEAVIGYGGIIGRAENRALVNSLGIEMTPLSELDLMSFDAIAMVDTQPGAGNFNLPEWAHPCVVLDHHQPLQTGSAQATFADVRPHYGSSSTLLVEYLRALRVPIDTKLATALFYGIKVDTQDLGRHASHADVEAYMHLFPLADKLALPKIEYPRLPREYFETFHSALERAVVYDKVILVALDEAENPNAVAEVADLLLRLEGMVWSCCLGFFADQLFVSVRTADPEANAYEVISGAMGHLGSRGGHGLMAGGRVGMASNTHDEKVRMRDEIATRFLQTLGVGRKKPQTLLRLREVQRGNIR